MSSFAPPINRNMVELDRSFFKKDVPVLAAYFPQPQHLGKFVKACQGDIFYVQSVKHIVPMDNSKAVLLRSDVKQVTDLSAKTQEIIKEFGIELKPYTVHLDYSFWKSDEILKSILPEELTNDIPSGFSQAGHLAHLNLRDEYKPYGKLIGQVIMDKNPSVLTVVDKANTIANKFRTFPLELLAGEPNYVVEQSESGCRFKFDFSKVYWNSRLSTEHERIISKFKPGEVVGDVFGGVGPFAIPASKKDVIVLANDLNPESYKYLQENIKLNKVDPFIKAYNLDGREFIRQSPRLLEEWYQKGPIEKKITKRVSAGDNRSQKQVTIIKTDIPRFYHHYVMNLPDSALTFLDEFVGLYSECPEIKQEPGFKLPMIHVHCFEKFENSEDPTPEELHRRVHKRICDLMKFELNFDTMEFHEVRMVSPTKPMFCVSFELPEEVAFK
ncbi:hypothetical protein G210_1005 [Candida maltosa Xu316]|uniref:tRNA (guanine(37)-N1)-methyltransferase n=1 Tax=Candida maltosa (strain Xu316) TaxID=1245528 RepID=M3K134_CANMX|nr:hypothetical protein G210_1005 [Candida maltosa Xu316]